METSTEKTFQIIVNGRERKWPKERISFEEIVILAYGSADKNKLMTTAYTVGFSRGHNLAAGTLVINQEIPVTDKMVFNATATERS